MENEKRRGGRLALAVLGMLTLLGLYVAAYYALVTPGAGRVSGSVGMVPYYPSPIDEQAKSIFGPMHRIDRILRPRTWKWPCDPWPATVVAPPATTGNPAEI
jgi:hypothetical protein